MGSDGRARGAPATPARRPPRSNGRQGADTRGTRLSSAASASDMRKRDRDHRRDRPTDAYPRDPRRARLDSGARTTPRGTPSAAPRLPADAPDPTADPKAIQDFIKAHKVCFNHARGLQCRRMVELHHCPYLHTKEPIPFNAYPRSPQSTSDVAAIGDHDENVLYVVDALTTWAPPGGVADAGVQDDGGEEAHA